MDEDTKELNEAMERFRLASNDLQVNYFNKANDFRGHEHCIDESFEDVQRLLFESLVRYPCMLEYRKYSSLDVQIGIEVKANEYPIELWVGQDRGHMYLPGMSFSEDTILMFNYFASWEGSDTVEFQFFSSKDHPETAGFRGNVNLNKIHFDYRRLPSKEEWENNTESIFYGKRLTELFDLFANQPDEAAKELLSMPKIPFQYYMYGFDILFDFDWFKISKKAIPAGNALCDLMIQKLKNAPDDFGPFVYDLMGTVWSLGERPEWFAFDEKTAESFAKKYKQVDDLLPPRAQRAHS